MKIVALFSEKLNLLMSENKISAAKLARDIHVDPSNVSRWLSGKRIPKAPFEGEPDSEDMVAVLSSYFFERCGSVRQEWLRGVTGIGQAPDDDFRKKLADWFLNGAPIVDTLRSSVADAAAAFMGFDGLQTAASLLAEAARKSSGASKVYVYISSEHSSILIHERLGELLKALYRMYNEPLVLVMEQGFDYERISQVIGVLMPHMQAGILEVYYISSSEKYLCYNISILAENAGMIMTTQPQGGSPDSCVSVFVQTGAFARQMKTVLLKLSAGARPLFRFMRSAGETNSRSAALFDERGELFLRGALPNILHAKADAYARLLKAAGAPREAVRYRAGVFEEQQQRFRRSLENGEKVFESWSIQAINDLIKSRTEYLPPPFSAYRGGTLPGIFAKSLLEGMLKNLREFENFNVLLTNEESSGAFFSGPESTLKIKEDSFLIYQTLSGGEELQACSENLPLVSACTRQFREQWKNSSGIKGRENVIAAIKDKIAKMED